METGERRRETEGRTSSKIEKFEDLDVWRLSMSLATKILDLLKKSSNFALRDQVVRAAISIPSNIAEGFEWKSNKEFIQHLYIAKGSCAELRTQIHLCISAGVVESTVGNDMLEETRKISAMLYRLIQVRSQKF